MGARLRRLAGRAASAAPLRCLLDEQLSREIARLLRERGLDAQAVQERSALVARPDEQLMDVAAAEKRALVTNNVKHFRPVAAERLARGAGHAGLILLAARHPRTRAAAPSIAAAIEAIMRANPGGIADSERWIAP